MQRIRAVVVGNLWWLVLIVSVAMLATHGFGVGHFVVDNTSLLLLLIVLLSPFVTGLKKIKYGDFEAEIEPAEVSQVARQVEEAVPEALLKETSAPENQAIGAAIRALAETDPIIALAKLRIELEAKLRRLHLRSNQEAPSERAPLPVTRLIRDLAAAGILDRNLSSVLRNVITICNRAIHGEDIRDVDARQIIDAGIDLLEALEQEIGGYATAHPVEKVVITPGEEEEFRSARYRLTTIVPLVDNPERCVYVLTQDELDAFFEACSECAEFAVGLEKLS